MRARLREEDGFGMVELVVAVSIIALAVLALMASFDEVFFSLHSSAKTSSAALLANNELETATALPSASIGLGSSAYTTALTNADYAADESDVVGSSTVATTDCTTNTNCLTPLATVTGSDGKSYTLEVFAYDVANAHATGSWTERTVTAIVRDPSASGSPIVAEATSAVDAGPS